MDNINKYFQELNEVQKAQFKVLEEMYPQWNEKINVISRKDIENLEVNHILHSLAIAKFMKFSAGTRVLDFGTGGGFPGIPLAICFPDVSFHLVDRVGKKLKVAQDIAQKANLNNVTFQHGDIKEVKGRYHFVVSRAVMDINEMIPLVRRLIATDSFNALPNGIICLKGGDLRQELSRLKNLIMVEDISDYFTEDFFETKKIVYYPVKPSK